MTTKSLFYALTITAFTWLNTGCSSALYATMSQSRLESPEVNATPLKFNVSTGANTRHYIGLEQDGTNTSDSVAFIQGGVTLGKGVEFYVKDASESIVHAGMKFQFWGDNREQAGAGNFSQAVAIGYEAKTTSEGVKQEDGVDCTYSCYWQSDSQIYDIAWILGYRINRHFMIYGGPFYQRGKMDLDTTQPGDENYDNSSGKQLGLSFATEFRFAFGMFVAGELSYTQTQWAEFQDSGPAYSVKLGYQF